MSRDGSLTRGMKPVGSTRFPTWLQELAPSLEQMQRDLTLVDLNLAQLKKLLQSIESQSYLICNSIGDSEVNEFYVTYRIFLLTHNLVNCVSLIVFLLNLP